MHRQARLCVVGSVNIDLTFRTPRLPRAGETLTGRAFCLGFGGKGANQAVAAARLGARVAMVARVGSDVFGEGAVRNLAGHGVDTAFVRTDSPEPSGVAAIAVDDAAQNCIIVVPGANGALSPQDVREVAPAITSADGLLCQLEVPLETTLEAFRIARAAGVRTVLNPAPAVPLSDELFRLADLCVPNETEIELLTGCPASTLPEVEAGARSLRERGASVVVVTLGSRGAFFLDGAHTGHVPALPVEAVDPTGAGDAFIGALGVFLAEGVALPEAVRRANAVAALSVTKLGTQAAFPSRAEAEQLFAETGPVPAAFTPSEKGANG